jgi:SAM-dependent methyltransferase
MPAYLNLCTEFYDIDKPEPPADAFAFYRRYASAAKGPILEPMCGSGRFLLPLLAEGFDIEGTDNSPQMLDACKRKAARRGLDLKVQCQSVDSMEVENRYHLAFIPSGSFSLFIDMQTVRAVLRRLHACLASGGKLVLEAEAYDGTPSGSCPWGGRWVQRPDGAKILVNWLNQPGPEPKVNSSLLRYELIKEGKILETEVEDFPLRFFEDQEMRQLLAEAGFSGIKRWKPFQFEEAGPEEGILLFEAVKP